MTRSGDPEFPRISHQAEIVFRDVENKRFLYASGDDSLPADSDLKKQKREFVKVNRMTTHGSMKLQEEGQRSRNESYWDTYERVFTVWNTRARHCGAYNTCR